MQVDWRSSCRPAGIPGILESGQYTGYTAYRALLLSCVIVLFWNYSNSEEYGNNMTKYMASRCAGWKRIQWLCRREACWDVWYALHSSQAPVQVEVYVPLSPLQYVASCNMLLLVYCTCYHFNITGTHARAHTHTHTHTHTQLGLKISVYSRFSADITSWAKCFCPHLINGMDIMYTIFEPN